MAAGDEVGCVLFDGGLYRFNRRVLLAWGGGVGALRTQTCRRRTDSSVVRNVSAGVRQLRYGAVPSGSMRGPLFDLPGE